MTWPLPSALFNSEYESSPYVVPRGKSSRRKISWTMHPTLPHTLVVMYVCNTMFFFFVLFIIILSGEEGAKDQYPSWLRHIEKDA